VARGVGQTLITFGLVALLFVVYELWVTDVLSAREQDQLTGEIQQQWADAPTVTPPESAPSESATTSRPAPAPIEVAVGDPFAVLHIPRLGADWERVVVEGTAQVQLAQGPGHYVGTAMPGEQGNVSVAGHRVGRGSPFLDLDQMRPGDPVVVETATHWFVYRVLGDPGTGSFEGDPSGILGQHIVRPTDVDVISPTPGGPADGAASGAYLTLTTCHPKYSAQQRLVIHARLDGGPLSKATAPEGPPALAG
jgi:sortase A